MTVLSREESVHVRWRRWTPLLTAMAGTLLTSIMAFHGYNVVLREYRQQFDHDAQTRSYLVNEYLNERLEDLDSVRRFIEGTDTLSRPTFHHFVESFDQRQLLFPVSDNYNSRYLGAAECGK
jgi:CHASE1-domain containing sensor protein